MMSETVKKDSSSAIAMLDFLNIVVLTIGIISWAVIVNLYSRVTTLEEKTAVVHDPIMTDVSVGKYLSQKRYTSVKIVDGRSWYQAKVGGVDIMVLYESVEGVSQD